MFPEKEWAVARNSSPKMGASAAAGILRLTLLFGSAAVALALFAAPFASRYVESAPGPWAAYAGLDSMATGSAGYEGTYVLRRSVLQASPTAICVIRDNGTRAGDC